MMVTSSLIAAQQQIAIFANCAFESNDVVEIRILCGDKIKHYWTEAAELVTIAPKLQHANKQGWNIYVGGNPRKAKGGTTAADVTVARCLFADFDDTADADEVLHRIAADGLPVPTLVVLSGHGVHVYWRLDEPLTNFVLWSSYQQALIAALGSDGKIKDAPRIMRLVGFVNKKPGKPQADCAIFDADPSRRYSLAVLANVLDKYIPKPEAVRPATPAPTNKRCNGRNQIDALDRCLQYTANRPPAIADQGGHNATITVACDAYRFGLMDDQVMIVLQEFNQRCKPPWTERELRHKQQEAAKLVQDAERGVMLDNGKGWHNGRGADVASQHADNGHGIYHDDSLVRPENRTDSANAKRLAARFGSVLRWCDPWKGWLNYKGTHWIPDNGCIADGLAKQNANDLWDVYVGIVRDIPDNVRNTVQRFLTSSNSAKGIRDCLTLAKPDLAITPEQLDQDVWQFNVQNGTLNLRTGELRPHSATDYITKLAPVTFDPEAECPVFRKFIGEIMAGNLDLIGYIRRLMGYTLTGDVSAQVLPFFYGTGANGKSTLLNVWLDLLGTDYAMRAPPDFLLAKMKDTHPTERADLYGKRLVICTEIEQGRRLNESLVKDLTGGERIRARRMNENFWEFPPSHTLIMCGNHQPGIRGTDGGIWRRVRLVPFTVTIPEERQDRKLAEKLQHERSGILNWMLLGLRQVLDKGLGEPEVVKAATAGYRQEQDTLGQFIDDRCKLAERDRVKAAELRKVYIEWCDTNGEKPLTQRVFGECLAERGIKKHRSNGWHYLGITLATDAD